MSQSHRLIVLKKRDVVRVNIPCIDCYNCICGVSYLIVPVTDQINKDLLRLQVVHRNPGLDAGHFC